MANIGVFCGSSFGTGPCYSLAAKSLACEIASGNHTLIYGGVDEGLMGLVAETCRLNGGIVRGIVPEIFRNKSLRFGQSHEIQWVNDMAARKSAIAEICDCYIVLPGGLGTLEEFTEVWSWAHLVENPKTIVLFNVNAFYDPLLKFLKQAAEQGFINPCFVAQLPQGTSACEVLELALKPSTALPKWINKKS